MLLEMLNNAKQNDADWENGRLWGLTYYAGRKHVNLLTKAYRIYYSENALGPDVFPSLKKFEAEVVSIILSLLHGDKDTAGSMTSGGTESILLSVKAHRDYFRAQRPGLKEPEMVIPATAHPAFLKAAHYFDIKPVLIPVDENYKADSKKIENACNERTIMIVASAPSFPQGVLDPISEIGAIALSRGVGLHVDACLGGFFLPFMKKLGYKIPGFDFSVPGVTAISSDLHKYGFASKGASAVLYKNAEYRRHQFFVSTEWPGGCYASPTMLGTRSGGLIAAAWTALMSLGEKGYMDLVKKTMKGTKKIIAGIKRIPGMRIVGQPQMSVFSYTSTRNNLSGIANRMEQKGWWMNRQNNPESLHMIITPAHLKSIDVFLGDLATCVAQEDGNPSISVSGERNVLYGGKLKCPDMRDTAESLFQNIEKNYQL